MLIFHDCSLLNKIEQYCKLNELNYIDGIVSYCEQNNVDVEVVAGLVKKDPIFSAKMLREAENLNFVKKSGAAKLPI